MGEIDAAGDIITGALLGRAIEPGAGEGHGGHGMCLNCGTALIGAHCHRCGQAGHVHRSLAAIGHEILHGVVHFEGKLWRTLPLLAWRPGELTRRYIEGERARFVSPMALFLFSIFVMFAVFSMIGLTPPADLGTTEGVRNQMGKARAEMVAERAAAVRKRAALVPGAEDYKGDARELDSEIAGLDKALARTAAPGDIKGPAETKVDTGVGWLNHGIAKVQKNPALALYKLQSNSYKFSWLLIPLSLPFVWLMFCWKRQYHLYDHMVFVTYSIAFMSLLLIALTGLGAIGVGAGWIAVAAMAIPVVHIYRQLKGAYRLRRWSAALRTIFLLWGIVIVLTLFLLTLVMLGLMG